MVNTRSAKENETKVSADEGQTEPTIEIGLETPDQSVDEVEKKTTESTPMPNAEEQKQKTMEFLPIDTVEDTTGNTPETKKDESQTKRTSFTERFAIKRHSGGKTEGRERQNVWNKFPDNNRGQPRRRSGQTWGNS